MPSYKNMYGREGCKSDLWISDAFDLGRGTILFEVLKGLKKYNKYIFSFVQCCAIHGAILFDYLKVDLYSFADMLQRFQWDICRVPYMCYVSYSVGVSGVFSRCESTSYALCTD